MSCLLAIYSPLKSAHVSGYAYAVKASVAPIK